MDGTVRKGTKIRMMATGAEFETVEVGYFGPGRFIPCEELSAGSVGYLTASIKDLKESRVGDTITEAENPCEKAMPGYKEPQPMVYCGIYPEDSKRYPELRDALEKLQLNDAALQYEPETSAALGFGFRCGFLGLLHLDVVTQRLEREYDLDLVTTAPSVIYKVHKTNGEVIELTNPSNLPDASEIDFMPTADIGIDMGSTNFLVYQKGKGITIKEPSLAAYDKDSDRIVAFGEEARQTVLHTSGNIVAIRPLRQGVIFDYSVTETMLKHFITKAMDMIKTFFLTTVAYVLLLGLTAAANMDYLLDQIDQMDIRVLLTWLILIYVVMTSHDPLLVSPDYFYPGIIGGKNGYTDLAQSTLTTFAERNGMTLIAVSLYATDGSYAAKDNVALLDYGFCNFQKVAVGKTEYNVSGGSVILPQNASLDDCGVKQDETKDASLGELLQTTYIFGDQTAVGGFTMNRAFWIGVYPGMTQEMLAFMAEKIREACAPAATATA